MLKKRKKKKKAPTLSQKNKRAIVTEHMYKTHSVVESTMSLNK